jgi:hypothetical protein
VCHLSLYEEAPATATAAVDTCDRLDRRFSLDESARSVESGRNCVGPYGTTFLIKGGQAAAVIDFFLQSMLKFWPNWRSSLNLGAVLLQLFDFLFRPGICRSWSNW